MVLITSANCLTTKYNPMVGPMGSKKIESSCRARHFSPKFFLILKWKIPQKKSSFVAQLTESYLYSVE